MKKNKYIIIVLALFMCFNNNVSAQGVSVDVQDIIYNYNESVTNGSITLNFDDDIYPVCVSHTSSPCGSPPGFITITSGSYSVSAVDMSNFPPTPCPGYYCFDVTANCGTDDECCISFCVEVSICRYFLIGDDEIALFCYEDDRPPALTGNPNDVVYVTGKTEITDRGNADLEYLVHTSLEDKDFNLISETIFTDVLEESKDIITKGDSPFLVDEQREIESDDPFIFKFDSRGNLIWVYHNSNSDNPKSKEEDVEDNNIAVEEILGEVIIDNVTDPVTVQTKQFNISKVFPNPFQNDLNINLESDIDQGVRISIINSVGRIVYSDKRELVRGQNNLLVHLETLTSEGLYLLYIEDENGNTSIEKLMHFKN